MNALTIANDSLPNPRVDAKTRGVHFLKERGAASVLHSKTTLLAHLSGVASILEGWEQSEDVVLAGLFHSVYGTEIFRHATLAAGDRATVRAIVGDRAEHLAWLFGTVPRQSVIDGTAAIDRSARDALLHVLWANELEQRDRIGIAIAARPKERRAFARTRERLHPVAAEEIERRLEISWVRRLLGDAMLDQGWTDRLLLATGPVTRLAGLCDHDFDALCKLPTGYTRAFFKLRSGEVRSFDLRQGQERTAYDAGATIYFHGLEDPRIRAWADGLDDELGLVRGLTRVSAFASLEGKGLQTHYDLNDNFVCQVQGSKRWRVAPNDSVRYPLYGYTCGRAITPVHRAEAPAGLPQEMPKNYRIVDMEPGTVMFMPRGTWHDTETTAEASLHFNIQCGLPTWRDLLDFVVSRTPLTCGPDLRAPALGAFDRDEVLTTASIHELEQRIELLLASLRRGEVSARAEEFHRYTALRRTRLFEYAY